MRVDPTSHPQYQHILTVSAAVLAAERDTDASIMTLAKLVTTTVEQFADANVPAALAQGALGKLSEAIATQVDSRRQLIEAHKEFGRTAKMLGATADGDDDGWGPSWPCPGIKTDAAQPMARPLKIAA